MLIASGGYSVAPTETVVPEATPTAEVIVVSTTSGQSSGAGYSSASALLKKDMTSFAFFAIVGFIIVAYIVYKLIKKLTHENTVGHNQ